MGAAAWVRRCFYTFLVSLSLSDRTYAAAAAAAAVGGGAPALRNPRHLNASNRKVLVALLLLLLQLLQIGLEKLICNPIPGIAALQLFPT